MRGSQVATEVPAEILAQSRLKCLLKFSLKEPLLDDGLQRGGKVLNAHSACVLYD
jgi:hypothetical protein